MYTTNNKKHLNNQIDIEQYPPINLLVFDKLLDNRILFLSGPINSYISEVIKANLLYLDSISNKDITLYINSPGGSIYDGFGILDTMEYIKSDIVTINTGLAASMSAVILCAGTKGKRKALKRSRTMIHQPSLGYFMSTSTASDIEIEANEIINLKTQLSEILSEKTGQPYDKIIKDSDRDYWMTSLMAKQYGIIDEIVDKRK
jgi:ATP-dependent Clp protease protease subunit